MNRFFYHLLRKSFPSLLQKSKVKILDWGIEIERGSMSIETNRKNIGFFGLIYIWDEFRGIIRCYQQKTRGERVEGSGVSDFLDSQFLSKVCNSSKTRDTKGFLYEEKHELWLILNYFILPYHLHKEMGSFELYTIVLKLQK